MRGIVYLVAILAFAALIAVAAPSAQATGGGLRIISGHSYAQPVIVQRQVVVHPQRVQRVVVQRQRVYQPQRVIVQRQVVRQPVVVQKNVVRRRGRSVRAPFFSLRIGR